MNKVQRNFKKQITISEKLERNKAKKGKGAFSNKLFLLRYYGYNSEEKKKQKLSPKGTFNAFIFIIKYILKFILLIIGLSAVLAISALIMYRIYCTLHK